MHLGHFAHDFFLKVQIIFVMSNVDDISVDGFP
jgi:hypothetical protein